MANSTIPNLVAVTVPALTDLFGVRQSGDTRDKKLTVTQLLTLIPSGGDVSKVGTPADGQVGVWTGDGTIEGTNDLTFNGGVLNVVASSESRFTGDLKLQTGSGQAPMLRDTTVTETNPSICPAVADANTGIGWKSGDRLSLISGGKAGLVLAESNSIGVIPAWDTGVGLTAFAGGGQGSAIVLDRGYNVVATVATLGDSVKLPTGLAFLQGSVVYIKNNGANACDVFPGSGDDLGAGVDTAISLAAGASVAFIGTTVDSIWTQLIFAAGGGGGGDVTKVGTPVNNQLGVWTGDGTIEGDTGLTWDGTVLNLSSGRARVGAGVLATPSVAIGEVGTGFYQDAATHTGWVEGGVEYWRFDDASFQSLGVGAGLGEGPILINEVPSTTNPTLCPARADIDTGIGWSAADQLSLVAGGVEIARAVEDAVDQFIISPGAILGSAALPSLAFGDGDSGFRELSDDALKVTLAGVDRWTFTADRFVAVAGNGPSLQNEASTHTNPTLIPALGGVSTGIGGVTGDISLIVGGVEKLRVTSTVHIFTGDLEASTVAGPIIVDEAASGTNPTLVPRRGDEDTGIGSLGLDTLSLISGAVEVARLTEVTGHPTLIVDPTNAGTGAATLSFGTGGSGFRQSGTDIFVLSAGASKFAWSGDLFVSQLSDGAGMLNESASGTNPTLVPDRGDLDTGIGSLGADTLSLIAGGVEMLRLSESTTDQVLIGPAGTAADPSLSFVVDPDTGFYSAVPGILAVSVDGIGRFRFVGNQMRGAVGGSPSIQNEVASASNPTLLPTQTDLDTGIGWTATDHLSLVAGGLDCINIRETGSARQIGFYTTAPISLQTGVAVSAAAIHAALVALGLITA